MCKKNSKNRVKSLTFSEFISNVRVKDAKKMRKEIRNQCHVSKTAYHKWVRGWCVPKTTNKVIINSVAESFGYKSVYLIEAL